MADTMLIIGGEAIAVPPLTFAALKRVWPDIAAMAAAPNAVAQGELAVKIFAAGLKRTRPDLTVDEIEQRLVGAEFMAVVAALAGYLAASGLVPSGEVQAGISAPP